MNKKKFGAILLISMLIICSACSKSKPVFEELFYVIESSGARRLINSHNKEHINLTSENKSISEEFANALTLFRFDEGKIRVSQYLEELESESRNLAYALVSRYGGLSLENSTTEEELVNDLFNIMTSFDARKDKAFAFKPKENFINEKLTEEWYLYFRSKLFYAKNSDNQNKYDFDIHNFQNQFTRSFGFIKDTDNDGFPDCEDPNPVSSIKDVQVKPIEYHDDFKK